MELEDSACLVEGGCCEVVKKISRKEAEEKCLRKELAEVGSVVIDLSQSDFFETDDGERYRKERDKKGRELGAKFYVGPRLRDSQTRKLEVHFYREVSSEERAEVYKKLATRQLY